MSIEKKVKLVLENILEDRIRGLIDIVNRKKSPRISQLKREQVNRKIEQINEILDQSYGRKLFKKEFRKHTKNESWRIRGRGWEDEQYNFEKWFYRKFQNHKYFIYVIWANKKGLYVGRTAQGVGRISFHFRERAYASAKTIEVIRVQNKSHLPKLECLGIHYLRPLNNRTVASRLKWTKSCPVCDMQQKAEREIRWIFRLR